VSLAARVQRISVTPVKSLRLTHPTEIVLDPSGARGDRRFFIVDANARLFNGKRSEALTRVVATYDGRSLAMTFPGGAEAAGPIEIGESITTIFHGEHVAVRQIRGPWADALSAFVGEPLRIVAVPDDAGGVDRGAIGGASLISRASLDELARVGGSVRSVDARRFRMLFEVDGVGPHEEDSLIDQRTRVGEAIVRWRGNVGRCVVTTRDPDTGVPDLPTLRILGTYRRDEPTTEPLAFGIYGEVLESGRVRVGDAIVPL
jgi:uncharacterized protein YcbX